MIDLGANGHAHRKKQAADTSVQLRQITKQLSTQARNIKKHLENHRLYIDS